MIKKLALISLVWLLLSGCSAVGEAQQPEALVLPDVIHDQTYSGNRIWITLLPCTLESPAHSPLRYCFKTSADIAQGKASFAVYIITVELAEGYQQGAPVDWNELIGNQKGSGMHWQTLDQAGGDVGFELVSGLAESEGHPLAVFVRIESSNLEDTNLTFDETHGPIAVLQLLPDGQGVARLDQ